MIEGILCGCTLGSDVDRRLAELFARLAQTGQSRLKATDERPYFVNLKQSRVRFGDAENVGGKAWCTCFFMPRMQSAVWMNAL